MNIRNLSCLFSICLSALISFPIHAASPAVAEAQGVTVTVDDLRADAERVSPNQRTEILGNVVTVQQASSNLLVRRALAAEALRDGLDKDPVVAAALQIQRDRALSDLRLAAIDAANRPSDEVVDTAARAAYKADPKRFRTDDQVRVRHILIAGTTEQSKAKAAKILGELRAGASFEELARTNSDDPATAAAGGDLGFFETKRMVPEFEEAVDTLKNPGDMSDVVKTKFGLHIIKLEEKRSGGQRTYEEVQDELRKTIRAQLQSDARLREASKIVGNAKFNREAIEAFAAPYRK